MVSVVRVSTVTVMVWVSWLAGKYASVVSTLVGSRGVQASS